jgi:hypothetical protein
MARTPMMTSGVPRGYANHKSPEAWRYRQFCLAKVARYGKLSGDALIILREAALCTIELERLHTQAEHAHLKNRRRDASRLARTIASARKQLLDLERRLEELAVHGNRTPQAREIFNSGDAA